MRMILIFICFSSICLAYDWSTNPGDGSPGNPYQISEPNQLIAIGSDTVLLTKHFILTHDILFDPNHNPAHVFNQPVIAYGVLENGSGPRFTGSFNGNNKTIYNLKIVTSGPCRALFGATKNAVIKNLKMKNTLIISESNVAAGLIGFMDYGTILDHCFVSGQISGVQKVGGMVGLGPYSTWSFPPPPVQSAAVITHCFSEGTVTGQMDVGGLVADFTGKISNCGTSATVQGTGVSMWIGGLAAYHGYNEASDLNIMTQCFSSGQVTGNENSMFVGGLAACLTVSAYDSYSNGTIFVGNNSQNIGGFTAVMGAGGLITVYGSATNCYNAAPIIVGEGSSLVGAFKASSGGSIDHCYFLDTSGPDNGYGEPLDDPNMMIRSNFDGWDFADDGSDGPNDFWRMCADDIHYPKLSWEVGQFGDYACPEGVGMDDLEALAFNWLTDDSSPDFNYACDGSGDGQINNDDLNILSRNWPNNEPGIINSQVGGCTMPEESSGLLVSLDESDLLRFSITVQGSTILFEDPIRANCCIGGIELVLVTDGNLIRLEEHEIPEAYCFCICTYPTTAVLGPFSPGEYTFEVVQISEFEMQTIGQVPVVIE